MLTSFTALTFIDIMLTLFTALTFIDIVLTLFTALNFHRDNVDIVYCT